MNKVWSKFIQGAKTLHYNRKLRFDDMFANQYKKLFNLDENKKYNILEIGCGTGALAGALYYWYPNAQIIAIDRDSEFIKFAREQTLLKVMLLHYHFPMIVLTLLYLIQYVNI